VLCLPPADAADDQLEDVAGPAWHTGEAGVPHHRDSFSCGSQWCVADSFKADAGLTVVVGVTELAAWFSVIADLERLGVDAR